jgi:hypothetical protein
MSSTTGVQNLLVNTLRPVYTYDAVATLYTVKLDLSNVNAYHGNTANVLWVQVGDSACNVYVGKEAGNDPTVTTKACSNVTALGYGAASNVSNVTNSVFAGTYAGNSVQTMSNMVGIGYKAGTGTASVRVGSDTSGNGISNTVVGSFSTTSTYSNSILIGSGLAADKSWRFRLGGTQTKPYILGDISAGWMGIGATAPITSYTALDVSGDQYVKGNLGVNIAPGSRTLDVNGNFRAQDASSNFLDFSNGVTKSSGGYVSIQGNVSVDEGPSTTTIGTIRRGIIHVSAIDQFVPGGDGNRAAYVYFAWTTTDVSTLSSNINGLANITTSSSNIQIQHTGSDTNYNYSITYFPLP